MTEKVFDPDNLCPDCLHIFGSTCCGRCDGYDKLKKKLIGQHWLEVARERVRAGEQEAEVMADYGYYVTTTKETIHCVYPKGCGVRQNGSCMLDKPCKNHVQPVLLETLIDKLESVLDAEGGM